MNDPLQIVGATFLGAFGQWAFARLIKLARPYREHKPENGNGVSALAEIKEVTARVRSIEKSIMRLEGSQRGMDGRIESIETWRQGL